jgi:hypothetical protein
MGRSGSKDGKVTERGFRRKDGLRMERNSSRASGGSAAAEGGREVRSGGSVVMSAMKENSESCLRVKRWQDGRGGAQRRSAVHSTWREWSEFSNQPARSPLLQLLSHAPLSLFWLHPSLVVRHQCRRRFPRHSHRLEPLYIVTRNRRFYQLLRRLRHQAACHDSARLVGLLSSSHLFGPFGVAAYVGPWLSVH